MSDENENENEKTPLLSERAMRGLAGYFAFVRLRRWGSLRAFYLDCMRLPRTSRTSS